MYEQESKSSPAPRVPFPPRAGLTGLGSGASVRTWGQLTGRGSESKSLVGSGPWIGGWGQWGERVEVERHWVSGQSGQCLRAFPFCPMRRREGSWPSQTCQGKSLQLPGITLKKPHLLTPFYWKVLLIPNLCLLLLLQKNHPWSFIDIFAQDFWKTMLQEAYLFCKHFHSIGSYLFLCCLLSGLWALGWQRPCLSSQSPWWHSSCLTCHSI